MTKEKPPSWPMAEKPDGSLTVLRADPKERISGRVMKLNYEKNYAFARASVLIDGDYRDYFFHRNEMEEPGLFGALTPGDRVTFIAAGSAKGPRALQVRRED